MNKQKTIGIAFILLSVIVSVIGYFVLPDILVMQVTLSGDPGTTLSKPFGLLLMVLLGVFGGVFTITSKEKNYRSYLVMVILMIVYSMVFLFNL